MDLQQMRYVLAVAEHGSFTRAARRCFVVQSALSHQIAVLERELGLRLFARSSRRVELTAAGQAFLPAARQALEAADRAAAQAAAAAGEVRGTVRIGIIPTVTAVDLPVLLRRFHEAHPQVAVSLRVARSDETVADIRAGRLDVGILGLPAGQTPVGVSSRMLAQDRHVAVIASDHRLAGRKRVRLAELAEESFADFPADSPGRAQTDLAFAEAGLVREVAYESTTADLIVGLVRQGLAVALLPSALRREFSGLHILAVTAGPTRTEHLAWDGFNTSPAAAALLELLEA
ncbi:LysR family transcriptional regulator [Nesterenkonia sp. HG001]|uniref:LysR family transcriptional regulator n=1 Tax=Nesterenkonia sp. HG001 TaxID=2983207 RepID=UPI002AC6D9F8|nr:LysR family transcriptional regulator [Nesterenkonia sp. HG001]MDZ5078718.1 LysR family transcriptional regulator [Nesterenkonia sp. HG001]